METKEQTDITDVCIPSKEKLTIKADASTLLVWLVLISAFSIGFYAAINSNKTLWAVVCGIVLLLLVVGYWYYVTNAKVQITYLAGSETHVSDTGCTLNLEKETLREATREALFSAIRDYRDNSMAWGAGYLAGTTGMGSMETDPFKAKAEYLQSLLDKRAYAHEKKGN